MNLIIHETSQHRTEMEKVPKDFFESWNFPNCLGCIDGKHVVIQAPDNTGSLNYKKSFSIVLLAVCEAKYRFFVVDIGQAGRDSDSGIFKTSQLGINIDENLINYPKYEYEISGYGSSKKLPYVFLADEGFALKKL